MAHKVSVVIANFEQARLTLGCIESVIEHTRNVEHEIIVVDNGSSASEIEILSRASHLFTLVRLDRNMFFGEASNIGAERATGDLVLFLNNDIKVAPRWLEPLIAALDTEYRAGAVGAKILDPNNELLEAGCVIRPDGWGIQIGKEGMKIPANFINATRITDYCSGACLLMRRQVFLDMGGFDPIFDPAYFEDVDLAIRLRSIGLFAYYCGASSVYHEESSTSKRVWSTEEREAHIATNHARLMARWGQYLQARLRQDLEPRPLGRISWEPEGAIADEAVVLHLAGPLNTGHLSRCLLQVAAAFQQACSAIIATDDTYSRCRVYSLCREFGVDLKSFRLQRVGNLDRSRSYRLVVSFGGSPGDGASGFYAPHLIFERDAARLLDVMSDLT